MHRAKPYIALICTLLVLSPAGLAADNSFFSRLKRPYIPTIVPQNSLANSTRIDSLLRGGNLYLSLQGRDRTGARE